MRVKLSITLRWEAIGPRETASQPKTKVLRFVCDEAVAEGVFEAACDAAVAERENTDEKETKVGGTS